MEVILREHVDNLGRRGEIVKVADGYARNYLLPRKLALQATEGNKKQIERERAKFEAKEAEEQRIAEAMAARKPVVATRVGGIPEVVEDGRTGFLVEPRQPSQIADRILQVLADPELRVRMGYFAWQTARARFNLERNVAELVKLYGIPQKALTEGRWTHAPQTIGSSTLTGDIA